MREGIDEEGSWIHFWKNLSENILEAFVNNT